MASTEFYILLGFLGIWFVLLIFSLVNLSRRKDIMPPLKVIWAAIIFIAPVLGLIFYLLFGSRKKI